MDQQQNTPPGGTTPQSEPTINVGDGAVQKNTLMAVLSYVGPLIILSFLTSKDDPFVKFHIKQGLVLFVVEIATWFIGSMVWAFWPLINLINLAVFILAILGILNAVKGREKALPIVGKFSEYFKI